MSSSSASRSSGAATRLVVPGRFNGPPRSGNGGWTSGALADALPGSGLGRPVTVRLRMPPPLDTPLLLEDLDAGVRATHQGRPVAEATYAETSPERALPVDATTAAVAELSYAGLRKHPFPTCFACGPERRPGDGLRIFPGKVPSGRVAATWTPFESGVAVTWAALDCIGGWSTDIDERPMVLGTMTARVDRLPRTDERYVVVGEQRGTEGRKSFTAATLFDPAGVAVATAEHVWIAIDPQEFS